ncbi:MAG: threonine synthase [Chloroherpetonaceae bacterium]|nr:threonine synthase [Chloroherpetonaceae bacterium]
MRLYSSNRKVPSVSLQEAVLQGLAADSGLFMPEHIPVLPAEFFRRLPSLSIHDIAFEVLQPFVGGAIPPDELSSMLKRTFNFDAPLVELAENLYALELFHGPTLAFKDFGARMLAEWLRYFLRKEKRPLLVLVATSGDTGSAVGHAFLGMPNTYVVLLYPSGKVSTIQEQQLTTIGGNVVAVELLGTFDDCQRLVKMAFLDSDLRTQFLLSSANSINIARLLPQMVYYFRAVAQLRRPDLPTAIAVPSGNFGNLTAGLFAKRMGLPVQMFIAATNQNDVVPTYLRTGRFEPRPSQRTLSNAMDVGNPSNFARMTELYPTLDAMRQDLFGISFSDEETARAIQQLYQRYGYLSEPHGAIGYLGLCAYAEQQPMPMNRIFLATAHPAKFADIVEPLLSVKIEVPARLNAALNKPKQAVRLPNDFSTFKAWLQAHATTYAKPL